MLAVRPQGSRFLNIGFLQVGWVTSQLRGKAYNSPSLTVQLRRWIVVQDMVGVFRIVRMLMEEPSVCRGSKRDRLITETAVAMDSS